MTAFVRKTGTTLGASWVIGDLFAAVETKREVTWTIANESVRVSGGAVANVREGEREGDTALARTLFVGTHEHGLVSFPEHRRATTRPRAPATIGIAVKCGC